MTGGPRSRATWTARVLFPDRTGPVMSTIMRARTPRSCAHPWLRRAGRPGGGQSHSGRLWPDGIWYGQAYGKTDGERSCSCQSNQEPLPTIRSVAGSQRVTNG
jgi:hypothetical protein